MKLFYYNIPKRKKHKLPVGIHEGVSKCFSSSLAYGIDSKKTLFQMYGYIPNLPKKTLVKRWTSGITSSSVLIGFIYYIYYGVYNSFISSKFSLLAGPLSSFATSIIKLPIYNSIKIMQSGVTDNIIGGGKKLLQMNGLYSGYKLSLLEDMIELDVRNRLYNNFKIDNNINYNIVIGTLSSIFASAITTPFDNIRLKLCVSPPNTKVIGIIKELIYNKNLFKGITMRMKSNFIKNIGFYIIFELLKEYL